MYRNKEKRNTYMRNYWKIHPDKYDQHKLRCAENNRKKKMIKNE
jgi:hypothetical protein